VVETVGLFAAPTPPTAANDITVEFGTQPDPGINWVVGATVQFAAVWADFQMPDGSRPSTVAGPSVNFMGPISTPVSWVLQPSATPGYIRHVRVSHDPPTDPKVTYGGFYTRVQQPNGSFSPWGLNQNTFYKVRGDDGTMYGYGLFGYPARNSPGPVTSTPRRTIIVSGIGVGPAGVIGRAVYRSVVNGSAVVQLNIIQDNTTTTLNDVYPDADIAGRPAPPTADTSGLKQPTGQVNAGATTIPLASLGPFSAAGGWARTGDQVIHYGGVSGNSLIGIPATGAGAIDTTIPYGAIITVQAILKGIPAAGVGAIVWTILRGDPVNILIILDDLPAQAALAAAVGGTGVREALLQDGRIGLAEANARARALLQQRHAIIESVSHVSRDPKTRSGAMISVNLPAPTNITGTFRVQDVTVRKFRADVLPNFEARSSSARFTFEDLLRRITESTPPPATGEQNP
jgi:hypothetical protein